MTYRLHQGTLATTCCHPSISKCGTQTRSPTFLSLSTNGTKWRINRFTTPCPALSSLSRSNHMELEAHVHELAGEPFNLGSKQLQHILFEKMGLPVVKKTPKGAPSTAEDVLQELALQYELPAAIMEFRGLTKLKNTYTDKRHK